MTTGWTLEHMLDIVRWVGGAVRDRASPAVDPDDVTQPAVIHLIQMLGEAATRVSTIFPGRARCVLLGRNGGHAVPHRPSTGTTT